MSGAASPGLLPRVFLSRRFPPGHFEELRQCSELVMHEEEARPAPDAYRRALRHANVLISMVGDGVGADLLAEAPRLRLIANCGVGFNNIDMAAATRRGILATNTPGVVTAPTAE